MHGSYAVKKAGMTADAVKSHMNAIRSIVICLLTVGWIICAPQAVAASHQTVADTLPQKRILLISSYHIGMPWANRIWKGLQDGFSGRKDLEFFIEFMDSKRLPRDIAFNSCYQSIRNKYAHLPFELIIISDDNALQFVKDYGQELFPGVPVVFCGANEVSLKDILDVPNMLGVQENRDIQSGLALALRLHPSVDHVFMVLDDTVSGRKMRNSLKNIGSRFPDVTFFYPDDQSFSQVLETAGALKRNGLIFFLFYTHDAQGVYFDSEQVVEQLVRAAHVPIYTSSDTYLGKGLVGGKVLSAYYQGLEASKLALRILNGEKLSALPRIVESPNKFMFDYPALLKAGISPEQLPQESIVLNKPVSYYEKYKKFIWGGGAALVTLWGVVIIMGVSILQRKKAQRELAAALEELQLIFDNTQAGIVLLDSERKIWRSNQRMADMFGYASPESMVGLSSREFHVSRDNYENFATKYLSRLKNGEKIKMEYRLKRRDGVELWAFIAGTTLSSATNKSAEGGALFILDDITDRKEAEMALENLNFELEEKVQERTQALASQALALQAANDRLKTLDLEKSSMLSSVSHDLRTPLTSIRGFVKLISKSFKRYFQPLVTDSTALRERAETIADNLAIIDYESERLTRLINDFLDLAKIEAGQLVWRDTELRLDKYISLALDSVSGQFAARTDVALEVDIEADLPLVYVDEDRIMQVLVNLLNNAAKHTQQGRVSVAARRQEGGLLVSITDTGCGIPKEHLPKIFEKFYQVEEEDTLPQQGKGTGLGLAICREIITHYKGRIWVESQYGVGSTFAFTLPGYFAS